MPRPCHMAGGQPSPPGAAAACDSLLPFQHFPKHSETPLCQEGGGGRGLPSAAAMGAMPLPSPTLPWHEEQEGRSQRRAQLHTVPARFAPAPPAPPHSICPPQHSYGALCLQQPCLPLETSALQRGAQNLHQIKGDGAAQAAFELGHFTSC